MKRLGMPVAALIGVALIGLFAMSWLLNRDALRHAVEAQIRAVTGLDLVVNGSVDVSVFPGSYVSFHDVGLKGGGEIDPALSVDVLTANLRLLPLLTQRFEIADMIMLRPRIHVVRDGAGDSNWTPFIENIARTMKPGADNPLSFSEIRIQDGTLSYQDPHNTEQLDDIDLSLAWPSISRSFAATGQFDWRGERVDGSISVSDFVAALSGDRSGLKARLASAPIKLAFDGNIANRASLMMEGTLTADSPSLRNALRWAGQAPPGAGGFGRFALKARASLVGPSLALALSTILLSTLIAVPLGVFSAWRRGTRTDRAVMAFSVLGFSVPIFVTGYALILLFAMKLGWLPVQGYKSPSAGLVAFGMHLLLPTIALSTGFVALIARIARSSVLEVMGEDFIRTARAKGITELQVLMHHALRNAAGPIANAVALNLSSLLGGVIIVEVIFSYPGLAKLAVDAVETRDMPLVQACAMIFCATFMLLVLVADICSILSNPRLRTR